MPYTKLRKVAKRAGREIKRAYKKRYMKKGMTAVSSTAKLVKDVMYLKSVLNPEKKKFSGSITDQQVGQCIGNNNGWFNWDITPSPSQNVTSSGRTGNSIKLHSTHIKYQFQAQSASGGSPIKFRIIIGKTIGPPVNINTIPSNMFNPTTFVTLGGVNAGIIDYNSDRREDTYKQYVVLRSKVVYLRPNNHTGQVMNVTGHFGLKYKSHHVKFNNDANVNISDGQLFALFVADNGNASTSVASTLVGTNATAVSTGALLQLDISHWFYDN